MMVAGQLDFLYLTSEFCTAVVFLISNAQKIRRTGS
jgi:hypothetical protein